MVRVLFFSMVIIMPDLTSFDGVFGAARSAAQILAILEKIDLAVFRLLQTEAPLGMKYRVGDRELDHTGYLQWLLEARRTYERCLAALPGWEATRVVEPRPQP